MEQYWKWSKAKHNKNINDKSQHELLALSGNLALRQGTIFEEVQIPWKSFKFKSVLRRLSCPTTWAFHQRHFYHFNGFMWIVNVITHILLCLKNYTPKKLLKSFLDFPKLYWIKSRIKCTKSDELFFCGKSIK